MATKPRNEKERLERILDGVGDYLVAAPGKELLGDAVEEGRNPSETTGRIKSILRAAFKQHQQRHLREALEGHRAEVEAISSTHTRLPIEKEKSRSLFMAAMHQLPQHAAAFTLQNRDFSEWSDEDIESHLKKLALLGALKTIKLPESE